MTRLAILKVFYESLPELGLEILIGLRSPSLSCPQVYWLRKLASISASNARLLIALLWKQRTPFIPSK